MIDFDTRAIQDSDKNFIFSTWLKSHRATQDNKRMVNSVYYTNFSEIVTNILTTCSVKVACEPGDNDHIYGYIAYRYIDEMPVVHFVYVKQTYRRLGIMDHLITSLVKDKDIPVVCTFTSEVYDKIKQRYGLFYNPFMRGEK